MTGLDTRVDGGGILVDYAELPHGMIRFAGGILQGNVNGNLAADFSVGINVSALVSGDFVL